MAEHERTRANWNDEAVIEPEELADLDQKTYQAINGIGGGAYSPTEGIYIGGEGLHLAGGAEHTVEGEGTILLVADGAKFRTLTEDAIELGGGANDWPRFTNGGGVTLARTRSIMQPFRTYKPASPWTNTVAAEPTVVGNADGAAVSPTVHTIVVDCPHDAAVLVSASVYIRVNANHSEIPAVLPRFGVFRLDVTTGVTESLFAAEYVFPTPASGPAWHNADAVQSWSLTTDQNRTIDRSRYVYFVAVMDEGGTNALNGNQYYGVKLTYEIADMRFP